MRGWAMFNSPYTRENVEGATKLFEQALQINPDYTEALIGLARSLTSAVGARYTTEPAEQVLRRADDAVTRALTAAPDHAYARYAKAEVLRLRRQYDAAIAEYDTAVAIDRNLAPAYGSMGINQIFAGRASEAFAPVETAIRLSPRDPLLNFWLFLICHAHTHLGEDAAAIEWCRKSVAVAPFWFAYVDLTAAYAWTGQKEEAKAALAELTKLKPNYTVKKLAAENYSDNPIFVSQYQRIVEGVRQAGLPED